MKISSTVHNIADLAQSFTYMLAILICTLELIIASQILELLRLIFVCNVISRRHCFHHLSIDTNLYTLAHNFLIHVNLKMRKLLRERYQVVGKRSRRSLLCGENGKKNRRTRQNLRFFFVSRKDYCTVPHSKQNTAMLTYIFMTDFNASTA